MHKAQHDRAVRVAQQKADEAEFAEKMLAKFADDEKLELMNAQKRRMRQQQHRRDIDKMLDEKRKVGHVQMQNLESQPRKRLCA